MSEDLLAAGVKYPPFQDYFCFKNNKHSTKIFQKLYEFYQTKQFVDIDLIVGRNTIKIQAHRFLLAATSDYFFQALENRANISYLEVSEVNEVVMESVLEFIYTGSIDLDSQSVDGIYKAAVLFKMSLLMEVCSSFMEGNINASNCLGLAQLAWDYKEPGLLKKSMAFAHDNFKDIRNGAEFYQMSPEIFRELFSSDFLHVDSEEVVLQSLLDWANFDVRNRHKLVSGLLDVVRFEMLDLMFITKMRESMRNIPECDDVIFRWLAIQIDHQHRKTIPKIRPRNMNHTYSIMCGESTDVWNIMTFNGVLDTWSRAELPSSSRKRTYFKSVVTVDNRVIIAGGKIKDDITPSVELLDLESKKWVAFPPMREARVGHAMALVRGDLFVMGGSGNQSNPLLSVERYSFNTRSWSCVGMLPSLIEYSHRHAIVNDRLYIMDFYRPKKIKCFNSHYFKWTELDFDHDVEKGFDMVAIGDDLIMCFAESNEKTIERYSPAEDKWTMLNSTGVERFISPRMFVYCNKVIFWGRANDRSGVILVEMYDPVDGSFTSLTPLPEMLLDLNFK